MQTLRSRAARSVGGTRSAHWRTGSGTDPATWTHSGVWSARTRTPTPSATWSMGPASSRTKHRHPCPPPPTTTYVCRLWEGRAHLRSSPQFCHRRQERKTGDGTAPPTCRAAWRSGVSGTHTVAHIRATVTHAVLPDTVPRRHIFGSRRGERGTVPHRPSGPASLPKLFFTSDCPTSGNSSSHRGDRRGAAPRRGDLKYNDHPDCVC